VVGLKRAHQLKYLSFSLLGNLAAARREECVRFGRGWRTKKLFNALLYLMKKK